MTRLDELAHMLPALLVSGEDSDRISYARDLWPRQHLAVRSGNIAANRPLGVVWPKTTEDVQNIVRFAVETKTPIVPFGAGSGVCGGILPSPEMIVLDLKKMTRWRRLDREAPSITVEAGAMGLPFEEDLNREGFTLGHFPSSILCSTVGGWLAGRSAGQCSGKYGKIEDMVADVEMVTGTGEIVTLHARQRGPNMVPFVVGSEGTFGVITAATLRLHTAPTHREFAGFGFPSTEAGWDGMRRLFQAGLRPAVSRLYDPFDAMLARRGGVKQKGAKKSEVVPGLGPSVLRALLQKPKIFNTVIDSLGTRLMGEALLVVIFEGASAADVASDMAHAKEILGTAMATYEGEEPARKWLKHRYSVSYRQAPVFEAGLFSDTIEVASTWDRLDGLYHGVRRALGDHVFVMAHLSHAYPDGCCIYFSFAGGAGSLGDKGCEEAYDRAWKSALAAAEAAGGTIAHHHGVGRSKTPRISEELGGGLEAFLAMKRVFDPHGIMNPGNLVPNASPPPYAPRAGGHTNARPSQTDEGAA